MPPTSALSDEAAAAHAESQRRRILDAAQRCFITRGFHAGSIGEIAAEAGISQGLMYRYFENKRALVLALIERQLVYDRNAVMQMTGVSELVSGLLACYQQWARGDTLETQDNAIANVALYAEITAEAHRDPVVAAVLRKHDKQATAAVEDWLRRHDLAQGLAVDAVAIAQRALLLRILVEGLAMRAVRDPDLAPATVQRLLETMIAKVMAD